MTEALGSTRPEHLLEQVSEQLTAAGIPLWRSNLGFKILHPLYDAVSFAWYRDTGLQDVEVFSSNFTNDGWINSPQYVLVEKMLPFIRRRLTGPEALVDFPLLEQLRDQGATDYFTYLVPFVNRNDTEPAQDGIVGSWSTDREDGFTDSHLQSLRRIQKRLAVACKIAIKEQLTENVLSAYLGPDAGRQVMHGSIQLGDGETIHAVIWFSDLRDSSGLADRLPSEEFIALVNDYFECSAGAVLSNGGEVLRFIGDAVLAIFPIRQGEITEAEACENALKAAADARARLEDLNKARAGDGQDAIEFGLGLHVGDVMYGNIGVKQRIEFSVTGPAANEAARLEGLTKTLDTPVLVSDDFAKAIECDWKSLGTHTLRGVGDPMEVFAPKDGELQSRLKAA